MEEKNKDDYPCKKFTKSIFWILLVIAIVVIGAALFIVLRGEEEQYITDDYIGTWTGNLNVSDQFYNNTEAYITKITFTENNVNISLDIDDNETFMESTYFITEGYTLTMNFQEYYLVFHHILYEDTLNINNSVFTRI
jgi:hypothetical protein